MICTARTEEQMRESIAPWPETPGQLVEYIDSLVNREHGYWTSVYAMSLAAVAAYNYVAKKLSVTGLQASCADLDIIRRTRHIEGPFIVLRGEDMLFPQRDLVGKLLEAMQEWKPWTTEEAKKKLEQFPDAHPTVIAHWEKLAASVQEGGVR